MGAQKKVLIFKSHKLKKGTSRRWMMRIEIPSLIRRVKLYTHHSRVSWLNERANQNKSKTFSFVIYYFFLSIVIIYIYPYKELYNIFAIMFGVIIIHQWAGLAAGLRPSDLNVFNCPSKNYKFFSPLTLYIRWLHRLAFENPLYVRFFVVHLSISCHSRHYYYIKKSVIA